MAQKLLLNVKLERILPSTYKVTYRGIVLGEVHKTHDNLWVGDGTDAQGMSMKVCGRDRRASAVRTLVNLYDQSACLSHSNDEVQDALQGMVDRGMDPKIVGRFIGKPETWVKARLEV